MDKIDELLTRGVENIIPGKAQLEKVLRSGKKLNIYNGIDPSATQVHIGNAVPLRKLQAFVDLGHHVTFLIGNFTALIGDSSDKTGERPILSMEEIQENFKTYKKQAEKVLDFSKVKVVHNGDWLGKLTFKDLVELCQHFSVGDFISRELIRKRLDSGSKVRLDEVLYPVMQGYDSYFLDTDIQLGGTDQTFNMQAGRTLQKDLRGKESFVIANGFLEGTDGRKMSKSWGNAIWLDDAPSEMFGKVMSLKDDLINQYFALATNLALDEIPTSGHPMDLKKKLAYRIVSELHSSEAAKKAQEEFEKTFQKRDLISAEIPTLAASQFSSPIEIVPLLIQIGLARSNSDAKRLLRNRAVEHNGQVLSINHGVMSVDPGDIIQVGKKKFVKFV